MDFLLQLQEKYNVDPVIILLVILAGFFQKKYLCKWIISKDGKFDGALKTLLVSAVFAAVWIALSPERSKDDIRQYFFSYVFATSLYELILRPFSKWIGSETDSTPEQEK